MFQEKQKAFEKRVVYAPSESSEHDTMNSEERHLFDELQAELIDFKTKMKDKEDFLNQQVRLLHFSNIIHVFLNHFSYCPCPIIVLTLSRGNLSHNSFNI